MFIKFLAQAYGAKKHQESLLFEQQIGYKLLLHDLTPGWINATHLYNMTQVWKKHGLNALGVNYFTIGAIKDGLCTRFDPESEYYQAWLGGYIVQFPNPREWTINDHYNLCVADQKNWLKVFGDKNQYVEIDYKSIKDLGNIKISGFSGKIFEGCIWSDSDVGNGNNRFIAQFLGEYESYQFLKDNPNLSLTPNNFIPLWNENSLLSSYQKIYLKGYGAIIEINQNTKAILYANGAIYKDKKGKKHDTFYALQIELKKLLKKIEIAKITDIGKRQ